MLSEIDCGPMIVSAGRHGRPVDVEVEVGLEVEVEAFDASSWLEHATNIALIATALMVVRNIARIVRPPRCSSASGSSTL